MLLLQSLFLPCFLHSRTLVTASKETRLTQAGGGAGAGAGAGSEAPADERRIIPYHICYDTTTTTTTNTTNTTTTNNNDNNDNDNNDSNSNSSK